ncbi:MAG: hypothetical protein R2856_22165 [Caldilineaceae bacterium]
MQLLAPVVDVRPSKRCPIGKIIVIWPNASAVTWTRSWGVRHRRCAGVCAHRRDHGRGRG